MPFTKPKFLPICLLMAVCHSLWAAPDFEITVEGSRPTSSSEQTKTSDDIQNQQINDQHDLVRDDPEVSVAEVGRYGGKGFAIRGVDGNRVAMLYDGVNLPNQQINQIFTGYGYMYEGRFAPDMELLSAVRLQAGADSFASGNGAMGGAVDYQSKEPFDILRANQKIGGYAKTGYSSKNEEWLYAIGAAAQYQKFAALINYAHRDGHELKNHRMLAHRKAKLAPEYDFANDADYQYPKVGYINSKAAILPDPEHYRSDAIIGKLYYDLTDAQQLSLAASSQKRRNHSHGFSKTTTTGERIGFDEANMHSIGVAYAYNPLESAWLSSAKMNLSRQKITSIANTYLYELKKNQPAQLSANHYRPQYDNTWQWQLEGEWLPLDWGALEHTLTLKTSVVKTDHELIMKEWSKLIGPDLNHYLFIGPAVKKTELSVALGDAIRADGFAGKLGLRYDRHRYRPYMTAINRQSIADTSDEYYAKRLYLDGEFDKSNTLENIGYLLGADVNLGAHWQAGYQLASGFLAPSVSQMYSAFEMLGNRLTTNVNLKPEQSLNHTLAITADYARVHANASVYLSQYRDFIDTVFVQKQDTACYLDSDNNRKCAPMIRNYIMADNIDCAKIWGLRMGLTGDISHWGDIGRLLNARVQVGIQSHIARDSTSKGTNLLASQPASSVLSLNILGQEKRYQLHAHLRHLAAKRARDAKVIHFEFAGVGKPSREVVAPYEHIGKSQSAWVFDVFGSAKVWRGLHVNAGLYNVFNAHYIPWGNLRALADLSINSMVDDNGRGIERYSAPGRHFALSLRYDF